MDEKVNDVNDKLKKILPPLAVIALVIAIWWIVVVRTESVIFPTPWQVVTGTWELVEDGTPVGAHRRLAVPRRRGLWPGSAGGDSAGPVDGLGGRRLPHL